MSTLPEIEEAVAGLQTEVTALRQILKMLLVQHTIENPNSLRSLAALFASSFDEEDGYTEYVRAELERLLSEAQHLSDAIHGQT